MALDGLNQIELALPIDIGHSRIITWKRNMKKQLKEPQ